MADIWCGEIVLPDGNIIKDVGLASNNVASTTTISTTALRFLATVDTARIPLYLATGPSLDVWTTSSETEEWFQSILTSKASNKPSAAGQEITNDWWTCARSQSPIGILIQVDDVIEGGKYPRITEILFYGTIATPAQTLLPTPPSSSPDLPHSHPERLPELRVHALPLSSDLLYPQNLPEFPSLPAPLSPADREPQFLPPLHHPQAEPKSPKRKRDIFEEAAIARKKARGKGGESIAAAAAKANESQRPYAHRKSMSIDTKATPFPDFRPPSAPPISRPSSRHLSRSPSISSDIRPLSKKGLPDPHTKRSNLSQVATVPLQPEEPTTESRNKEALSKVVMAAMRMHGLQQRKRSKSHRGSAAPGAELADHPSEEAAAEEAAKDEEYKLIYHQTFKGAVLALRKHISIKPLHSQPDRLRDVVEKLLTIFCTDPLAQPLPHEAVPNPLATPGSKQRLGIPGSTHSQGSPFDLPSGAKMKTVRSMADSHEHTGSPVNKKKPSESIVGLT